MAPLQVHVQFPQGLSQILRTDKVQWDDGEV